MSSLSKQLETAAIADLLVLEAAGSEWVTADSIGEKVCIPMTQARRAAARLARSGALQKRVVNWKSARCRVRVRFEYRLPPTPYEGWDRHPPWLEPAWHPVDCNNARRIVGKSQQLFEVSPVTEQDLFELPRGVRERFQAIPDETFYSHPDVAASRDHLAGLEASHRKAAEVTHQIRTQIVELESRRDACRLEVQRLADLRPRQIADLLLADKDLEADRAAVAEIEKLQHFATAVDLARPALDRKLHQASEATRQIVSSIDGETDHIRGLIDRLKLAEAERLAYA